MKEFIPKSVDLDTWHDRFIFMLIALCGLYDDLITILSLGLFTTNVRATALFDWFDYDGE